MKTFSLQTRLYSGIGSLKVLNRFTHRHIWIICDGFLAHSPLLETLRGALPADNKISIFTDITPIQLLRPWLKGLRKCSPCARTS